MDDFKDVLYEKTELCEICAMVTEPLFPNMIICTHCSDFIYWQNEQELIVMLEDSEQNK